MLFSPDDDNLIAVAHGLRWVQYSEVNLPFLEHACILPSWMTSTLPIFSTSWSTFATIQNDKLYIK